MYAGERLRELRRKAGHTQESLAKQVGISFQQIQKCERALNRITAGRMWDMCQVLGARPCDFFPNKEDV